MCERPPLAPSCCPVFALHHSIVGCGGAERDSISLVVCAHACKRAAPGDPSLEVVNVRRLQVWPGRLIMATVSVEPRNGIRIAATIRSSERLSGGTSLCQERSTSQRQGLQEASPNKSIHGTYSTAFAANAPT